ncbi:MAG TPA: RNA polymerase sigma factor SigJ [Jiangellaceae bacterium]|nr:RNA polymerase sigma factor SigJ [Jiangellaceae bacterium]
MASSDGEEVGSIRADEAAAVFAELRPYLNGVAYRLTSSWADAEDVVADAWPRWSEWAETVDDPRGWLTRVVARLAIDHLRSARVRRESYIGPWLPEPVITTAGGPRAEPDPLEQLVTDESVRLAFLVVLDELPPEQRVAVVLHDVLGVDFAGVADVLGCSPAAARQHASRGRRRVKQATPPARVPSDQGWGVLGELSAALRSGDLARLSALLAPDVVMTADGAGRMNAAGRPLMGVTEVARFLHGLVTLAARLQAGFEVEPVLVNGDPGFVIRLDSHRPRDPKVAVYAFTIDHGRIAAIYAVLAPEKLSRSPGLPPAVAPTSTPRQN